MSPPPLFLSACAVLWGFETGHWLVAAALALVLESHRVTRSRWDLDTADFRRIGTLCNILLLLMVAYFLTTLSPRATLPRVLQWWPLALLPLVVAGHYSTVGRVSPTALFMVLKRRADSEGREPEPIDLGFPYAAALVLGAAGGNTRDPIFYGGLCLLAAWALFGIRPRRSALLAWTGSLAIAAALGLSGHLALNRLQHWLLDAAVDYLAGNRTDPHEQTTHLGHLGSLKLSDDILMRVEGNGFEPPLLLHRASYDTYRRTTWLAVQAPLRLLEPPEDMNHWILAPGSGPASTVTISTELDNGVGVLALPAGAARMDNPFLVEVKRNHLGTFRVVGDDGLIRYVVTRFDDSSLPDAPREADLALPTTESALLENIVSELGLRGRPPAEVVKAIADYFDRGFRYSLYREDDRDPQISPLAEFLSSTKTGHCEYFATASTLLARAAGVPARYATGFSVQEYSELEDAYLVRLRHAHAWTRVWVDGRWRDLDTTPPDWFGAEGEQASALEPLLDLLSWAWHRFQRWQMDPERGGRQWVLLLALPVIGYLVWRLRGQRRRTTLDAEDPQETAGRAWPGLDSELLLLETRLAEEGLGRRPGESTRHWAHRLAESDPRFEGLPELVTLHYRCRFAAQGATRPERNELRRGVSQWLQAVPAKSS